MDRKFIAIRYSVEIFIFILFFSLSVRDAICSEQCTLDCGPDGTCDSRAKQMRCLCPFGKTGSKCESGKFHHRALAPLAHFQLENAATSRSEARDIFAPNSLPSSSSKLDRQTHLRSLITMNASGATDSRRIFPVAEQEKTQKAIYSVRVAHGIWRKRCPNADAATTHKLLMKTHCALFALAHTSSSRPLRHFHF